MHYYSDLGSTDVLRQAVCRLPNRLRNKWAEHSYKIRRTEEPTLGHLENWLGHRIMAARDPYLPSTKGSKGDQSTKYSLTSLATRTEENIEEQEQKPKIHCDLCSSDSHKLFKCRQFLDKSPVERVAIAREKQLCFNCLNPSHLAKKCASRFRCNNSGCKGLHHTRLHDGFSRAEEAIVSGETRIVKKGTSTRRVFLQVVAVKVITSEGKTEVTYAMLDNCSEGTLIREDFCEKICHTIYI